MLGRTGRSLADAARSAMTAYPQVLVNVKVSGDAKKIADACATVIHEVEAELGDRGRVLVRASGTEPLLRVMIEAEEHETARRFADRIADHAAKVQG